MSRFFAAGSESESESSASEEEIQQKPAGGLTRTFAWSDDEEDVKRVVRSAKDKRYEELQKIIKDMKNHKKIKDMHKLLSDFEDLGRAYDKAKKVVEKEGIPRFYIRCLVELDSFISECWEDREGRKSMSKNNAKGLTTLRQKLRRYNRDFESELEKYKANPDQGDEVVESEEEDKEEDSEDDEPIATGADFFMKGAAAKAEVPAKSRLMADDEEESDSDDMWGDDSESETSSSEDEVRYGGQLTADYFRKKVPVEGEIDKKKRERRREEREERKKIQIIDDDKEDEEEGWEQVRGGAPTTAEKPKMFSKDAEITHELVYKKLMEILSARGKKATDRSDQIGLLIELRNIATANNLGYALDCRILFDIVGAIFDYNPNIATCMKSDMWNKCMAHVEELLTLLMEHKDTLICGEHVAEESENFSGEGPFRIRGCILTMVERMDEEYIKMLQACDAHSTEYVERLKDEIKVCRIIKSLRRYIEKRGTAEEICRCYLKTIEHIYYKFDHLARIKKLNESLSKSEPAKTEETNGTIENGEVKEGDQEEEKKDEEKDEEDDEEAKREKDSCYLVDKLCKFIYSKDTTDRIRTRSILCHIYHHALHDRWFQARDIMLMSHLQDTIQHSDIPTQIMYNRAMVQLGLCAFRQGMIKDAHNCLVDIQSGGRAKELLAQGLLLQRQHERTPEQEKIEKRRQMPYHMHINLEMLECVYLVSAMLMEIPYMAAHEFDARRRMISKNFHHVLRVSERQPLVGPPESMREHVVAASKAMKIGDWKACRNFIINEKMNAKVWDLFYRVDHVRDMITAKIQEESLRTYLFTYSSIYDSLSMDSLAEMFELERSIVHSTISKMIINEELKASLDEPTQTVVMHRTEPTRLQSLSLQLSEKVATLVEHNERMMEVKSGGSGFFQRQDRQNYDNRDRNQQGSYGDKRRYGGDKSGGYGERRNYGDKGGGYGSRSGYGGRGGYRSGRQDQKQNRY